MGKLLDLDKFGEIIDEFIKKIDVGLFIHKDAGSEEWEVMGAGAGAVLDFYVYLNGLPVIFMAMLKEMDDRNLEMNVEKLAETMSAALKKEMIEAGKEKRKQREAEQHESAGTDD